MIGAEEVLQLDTQNMKARYRKACTRSKLGDTAGALAEVRHALEVEPNHEAFANLKRQLEANVKMVPGRCVASR